VQLGLGETRIESVLVTSHPIKVLLLRVLDRNSRGPLCRVHWASIDAVPVDAFVLGTAIILLRLFQLNCCRSQLWRKQGVRMQGSCVVFRSETLWALELNLKLTHLRTTKVILVVELVVELGVGAR